jgi:hypothetical protein
MSTDRARFPHCSNYHFTLLDNPKFAGRGQRVLDEKLSQMGWSETTPAYRREYKGEWCRDPDWLVYAYEAQRNLTHVLPEISSKHNFVLSVDIGSSETKRSTCYCVLAYRANECVVVEVLKKAGETTKSIGDQVAAYERKYNLVCVVMDAGGLGGSYVKEIKPRIRCPVKPAEKSGKLAYIELINSDLRTGALHIHESCKDLLGELTILQWAENRKGPDPRYEDHACDAMLYGWRECRHYQPEKPKIDLDITEEQAAENREDALAQKKWWQR